MLNRCFVSLQLKLQHMKKVLVFYFLFIFMLMQTTRLNAQCSICTKTTSQLGEKQGKGLNAGILYLMLSPFAIGGYIGYRWWKSEKSLTENEA